MAWPGRMKRCDGYMVERGCTSVEGSTSISRAMQKRQTRGRIEDAALRLIADGCGFSGLGLRQVTREAGLTPAAFYRHFPDMDSLGLALVSRGGHTLRRLLRQVRRNGIPPDRMLRASVQIFFDYVLDHRVIFAFIAGERNGGSVVIRQAIRAEEARFVEEMAVDLTALETLPHLGESSMQTLCRLVVTSMFNAAADVTDLPDGDVSASQALADEWLRQLRLIFIGARHWRESRSW